MRLADEGISAFRGKNAAEGKLAEFLEHVKSGEVPKGSYLLVENLDRITRARIDEAQFQLMGLMRSGIIVVTLMDERRFEWGAVDMTDLIVSLAILSRGHEESATKSKRLKAAWEAKRAQMAQKPITAQCPAWLKLDKASGHFEVLPERAAVVGRVFEMAKAGSGQHKIAATLNAEGILPWGRAQHWQRSYISKMLKSRAVVGTMVPHLLEHDDAGKRRVALDPIDNYYPSVVSPQLFAEVQDLLNIAGAQRRGKNASGQITNILGGMAVCPLCGRTMTRVQKGSRSRPSLVCTRAKAGAGCKYHSVPYSWVEEALLRGLPKRLALRDGQDAVGALAEQAEAVDLELEALREAIDNLLDNMAHESSPALSKRLRLIETEYEAKRAELSAIHDRQAGAAGLSLAARADRAIAALQPQEGPLDRGEINRALKGLFKRAVINWPESVVSLEWTHGGVCDVHYALANF